MAEKAVANKGNKIHKDVFDFTSQNGDHKLSMTLKKMYPITVKFTITKSLGKSQVNLSN